MGLGAEAYLDPALRGLGHLSVLLGCAILTAIFHTRPGVMPEGHRERRQDGIRKRVSNACQRCRQQKIRCSGRSPCEQCTKRGLDCSFHDRSEKIWVSRGFLEDLEKKAQSHGDVDPELLGPPHDEEQHVIAPRPSMSYDAEPPTSAAEDTRRVQIIAPRSETDSGRATPSAQLVNPFSSHTPRYVADSSGRPYYLGTSSNWAFNRQILSIVHERLTGQPPPADRTSFDGTLYDLGWDGQGNPAAPEADLMPSADYAMYLINAVKFHCGQMFHLFHEQTFMQGFNDFHENPDSRPQGLWFVHFLLILAFGKAFTARRTNSRRPPGCDLYVQAMKLMPDITFLMNEPLQAVEILCCKALYLQCLDFRCAAYNVIGQALRIALEQGMHANMQGQGLDDAHVQRSMNAWWTVYILDRQMSSLMGVPLALKDSEISAPLPAIAGSRQKSLALEIHVKLSRILSHILNTVYGSEGRLTRKFISSTKSSLKDIAEISDELKSAFGGLRGSSAGGISRLVAHLHLLHHQCVVLATRPLLFSLLKLRFDEPNGGGPLATALGSASRLLQTCVESSQHIVAVLDKLKEQNLLESFLPFDLEAAIAASVVLLLAPVLDAELLTNNAPWMDKLFSLLDEMAMQGQLQAGVQKFQLQHLQQVFCSIPYPLSQTPEFPPAGMVPQQNPAGEGVMGQLAIPDGADDLAFADDAIWRTDFTAEHLMAIANTLDLDGIDWMTSVSSGLGDAL